MLRLLFAAVLTSAALTGCDMPRSIVHGTVRYQGRPLANATIIFFGRDNQTYQTNLRADGTYQIGGIPRGLVRVAIQQQPPKPRGRTAEQVGKPADAGDPAAKDDSAKMARRPAPKVRDPLPIIEDFPAQFADPDLSGLSFELKDPDQDYSPDLK